MYIDYQLTINSFLAYSIFKQFPGSVFIKNIDVVILKIHLIKKGNESGEVCHVHSGFQGTRDVL